MSRTKAKQEFSLDDLKKQTEGVECSKDANVLDEIPGAYKDIDVVMEQQKDLVDIVHTLIFTGDVKELYERQRQIQIEMMLPETSCTAGDLGELTPGTKLELIEPNEECGDSMRKVRVLQGKLFERVGCVILEDINLVSD